MRETALFARILSSLLTHMSPGGLRTNSAWWWPWFGSHDSQTVMVQRWNDKNVYCRSVWFVYWRAGLNCPECPECYLVMTLVTSQCSSDILLSKFYSQECQVTTIYGHFLDKLPHGKSKGKMHSTFYAVDLISNVAFSRFPFRQCTTMIKHTMKMEMKWDYIHAEINK